MSPAVAEARKRRFERRCRRWVLAAATGVAVIACEPCAPQLQFTNSAQVEGNPAGHLFPGVRIVGSKAVLAQVPIDKQIGAGTTNFLRWIRTYVRRIFKVVRHATRWWLEGLLGLIGFSLAAVLAAVLDREVLERWSEEGLGGLMRAIALGAAVYLRLLLDGRTPIVGKLLLAFAVAYGVAGNDLVPDNRSLRGYSDDLALVLLCSRSFMRMCPDEVVEDQARAAATRRARVEQE